MAHQHLQADQRRDDQDQLLLHHHDGNDGHHQGAGHGAHGKALAEPDAEDHADGSGDAHRRWDEEPSPVPCTRGRCPSAHTGADEVPAQRIMDSIGSGQVGRGIIPLPHLMTHPVHYSLYST